MEKYPKPLTQRIPFDIVHNSSSIWASLKKIRSYTDKITSCPVCESSLIKDEVFIPVSPERKAKVNGLKCKKCNCFYTNMGYYVKLVMQDNEHAKAFTLDGVELWNFSRVKEQERREKNRLERRSRCHNILETIPSSVLALCAENEAKENLEIVIVYKKEDANPAKNIFHYASEGGREFLSAAFAKERKRKGFFNGHKFNIFDNPVYKKGIKDLPEYIAPFELAIQPGGGYSSSIVNDRYEIVDILIYSLSTQRYEIIKATFNKNEGSCFVDISRFRNYVRDYGKPTTDIFLNFKYAKTSGGRFNNSIDLRSESILKAYGYAVSEKENLSDEERHKLLAEIIDLELRTQPQILKFLDFLISTRPHQPRARGIWQEDKKFVESYNVNAERFMFVK